MKKEKNNSVKADVSGSYLQVLKLVKSGMTIQNACVVVNINELNFIKTLRKNKRKN